MQHKLLTNTVVTALEDIKASNIKVLPVSNLTDITDTMIICSGTSTRHVKSISNNVVKAMNENGFKPLGLEGGDLANWVLIDCGDVVVHVMLPETREFYDLESLWDYQDETCVSLSA